MALLQCIFQTSEACFKHTCLAIHRLLVICMYSTCTASYHLHGPAAATQLPISYDLPVYNFEVALSIILLLKHAAWGEFSRFAASLWSQGRRWKHLASASIKVTKTQLRLSCSLNCCLLLLYTAHSALLWRHACCEGVCCFESAA